PLQHSPVGAIADKRQREINSFRSQRIQQRRQVKDSLLFLDQPAKISDAKRTATIALPLHPLATRHREPKPSYSAPQPRDVGLNAGYGVVTTGRHQYRDIGVAAQAFILLFVFHNHGFYEPSLKAR